MVETSLVRRHHFEPIRIDGVWTVPCPEIDIKVAFDRKYKNTDGFEDLGNFRGSPVLISGPNKDEIGSIANPLPSQSPESKAGYILWREIEIDGEKILIAVQMLGEDTMTSHHTHASSREVFHRMLGKLYNFHNQEVVRVENRLRIHPGDSHLSFTTDSPAITLLVQRGESIEHDYLPQPDYEFLRQQATLLDKQLIS